MIRTIADFAPDGTEAGVGLVLQDQGGRYLFFIAGTRHHHCASGELFYAGIGGHREAGEDWLDCAHREAREEIGADIEVVPVPVTWHVSQQGLVKRVEVSDQPRPFGLYEMIHSKGTPREGKLYRIVMYKARLCGEIGALQSEEVRGVIALTAEQVIRGPEGRPTLTELLDGGASLVVDQEQIDPRFRLYPLGTARALARVLLMSSL
jgi:8-oxo-dGTP pyrophosphatase MutT (NUDIX family)